jgi:hypothetical protein
MSSYPCPEDGVPSGLMEIIEMAQNSQAGTVKVMTQNGSLQLHVPGLSQFKNLEFIQSADHPTDLVVKFPDGHEIVFPDYIPLAQAGSPPAITLDDGTVIPGQEIVGLIDNLNYDLIAPGAGDQGGDGANTGSAAFIADPSGPLGDDIGHGPYAGGIHIADQVGFEQLPGYLGNDGGGGGDNLPFETIDDHVIHNIQSGIVDIPDEALRHNDIYPRGDWDLTSVDHPGPSSPPQSNFESETVFNTIPGDGDLGSTEFYGSNTTARFVAGATPGSSYDNNGDTVAELNSIGLGNEFGHRTDGPAKFDTSPFAPERVHQLDWDTAATVLETAAPGSGGSNADWDGASIYLYQGETITLSYDSSARGTSATDYVLAIDDPNVPGGTDPLGTGTDLNWDITNYDTSGIGISTGDSISYTVTTEGWHYIGTGFNDTSGHAGDSYFTLVEIDGVPYGEFDYSATDGVLSDSAHVIVDAIEESNPGGRSDLIGDSGDDIIISGDNGDDLYGNGGMDVLLGRGGDDHLTGGTGSDLFLFENAATDGNDTIFDFNAAQGDIINLDALFDTLGVATREVLSHESAGNTVLTIGDGTGTDTALAAASGFSVTLDGSTGLDIAQLTTDGNIVVDQS